MTRKKEQLFQLIKSLSKEEKRHFKLQVNKYNSTHENNYIRLFNAIDKQEVYDEEVIKKQFDGETFVKQLTVTKNYLLKQILKSLQNLYHEDSVDLQALVMHHQIAILFKKGQYDICRSLAKKGIELSAANDLFLEWIGFLQWEIELINKTDIEQYKKSLEHYLEQTKELLMWYEITTKGIHLNNQLQLFSLGTPTYFSKNNIFKDLIKSAEELINTTATDTMPLATRYNLFYPLAQSYMALGEYEKAYYTYQYLEEELKSGYSSKNLSEQYISVLTGILYSAGTVNKPGAIMIALNALQSIPDVNDHVRFKKDECLTLFTLITSSLSGKMYDGLAAIEMAEDFLVRYQDKVNEIHYCFSWYYSAYLHLGCGNSSAALKYLRRSDEYLNKDLLPDLKLAARIMEIVIFFEQGKFDLLESRLHSLQRQFKKSEMAEPAINLFMDYFNRIARCESNSAEMTALMRQFCDELLQLNRSEQMALFVHCDLVSWLESKIQGCPLGERIRQNGIRLFSTQKS